MLYANELYSILSFVDLPDEPNVNELYSINSNPWLITYKLYNLQHY